MLTWFETSIHQQKLLPLRHAALWCVMMCSLTELQFSLWRPVIWGIGLLENKASKSQALKGTFWSIRGSFGQTHLLDVAGHPEFCCRPCAPRSARQTTVVTRVGAWTTQPTTTCLWVQQHVDIWMFFGVFLHVAPTPEDHGFAMLKHTYLVGSVGELFLPFPERFWRTISEW